MGNLFVVAAASGTGKTSLVQALVSGNPRVVRSVSHTTRPRRPEERPGVDYHFVEPDVFESMQARAEFLEHARVFGHRYGTARQEVATARATGHDVVLVIDWQGHRAVRAAFPETIGIFLLPPSRAELERRLRGRDQDGEEVIRHRLAEARDEIAHWQEFDYLVVNRDFGQALADLQAIVQACRHRRACLAEREARLLRELLEDAG